MKTYVLLYANTTKHSVNSKYSQYRLDMVSILSILPYMRISEHVFSLSTSNMYNKLATIRIGKRCGSVVTRMRNFRNNNGYNTDGEA